MEAELVAELPRPPGWQYEPKWDGFRGVLENLEGELALWSRNGRPLLRYFPELRPLGDLLPPRSALEAAGLDGVVCKKLDVPYLPGSRDGVLKVKKHKTADCVIVGFRWSDKVEGQISTLLLGLYDDSGRLDFVGHASGFPAAVRRELHERLPPLREEGFVSDKRIPGGQSRWSR